MSFNVFGKYKLEIAINGRTLNASENIIDEFIIYESIHQALPSVDIKFFNNSNLLEETPLTDGSIIDFDLTITQTDNTEEVLRLETILWSHEIIEQSEGIEVSLHCVLSAPDFFNGRRESVKGSSRDVFEVMAERSNMTLITDSSVDKQVWIRPGVKGNIWLNDVINRSWASPKSCFVYAVTRQRELLRYNLDERAVKNPIWTFQSERERPNEPLGNNVIKYKYPKFSSQSGLLNTFFGYGRQLSTFDVDQGELIEHKPKIFTKRTNFMNLNENREVPQRYDSLGFGNSLNVHENYFNAFAQNMRLKSFYSVNVNLMSDYFRDIRLLDRVTLQLNDEAQQTPRDTYAGEYFIEKISTILDQSGVVRRVTLVREGYNADKAAANNSK